MPLRPAPMPQRPHPHAPPTRTDAPATAPPCPSDPHVYTFSPAIDELLQASPVPVLVVRSPRNETISLREAVQAFGAARILVPSTGTRAGKPALEFGIMLARRVKAECTVLFAEERSEFEGDIDAAPLGEKSDQILTEGEGLLIRYLNVQSDRPGRTIVEVAKDSTYDLIILSARLRPGTSQAYLGPQVDYVLRNTPCPIAILVTP